MIVKEPSPFKSADSFTTCSGYKTRLTKVTISTTSTE